MSSAFHRGHVLAFGASLFWGLMPVYFKLLGSVGALEIVAHRILWAVPALLLILALRHSLGELRQTLANRRLSGWLVLSSLLIAANWLIYVWAVNADLIVAASLGYFISPLMSVLLGTLFLRERLIRLQWLAIAVATLGVLLLARDAWQSLWVSLLLGGSWALYSLVRKIVATGPITGLTVETALLWPPALGYLLWLSAASDSLAFGNDAGTDLLLVGGAVVTIIPLMLFASAVRTVALSTMGLMSYIAPMMQFMIGVIAYREPLTSAHWLAFPLIWSALALYSVASWQAASVNRQVAS